MPIVSSFCALRVASLLEGRNAQTMTNDIDENDDERDGAAAATELVLRSRNSSSLLDMLLLRQP